MKETKVMVVSCAGRLSRGAPVVVSQMMIRPLPEKKGNKRGTMVKNSLILTHLIIHFPTSWRMSEQCKRMSKRTSEWPSTYAPMPSIVRRFGGNITMPMDGHTDIRMDFLIENLIR